MDVPRWNLLFLHVTQFSIKKGRVHALATFGIESQDHTEKRVMCLKDRYGIKNTYEGVVQALWRNESTALAIMSLRGRRPCEANDESISDENVNVWVYSHLGRTPLVRSRWQKRTLVRKKTCGINPKKRYLG
jgi:hypothetical protein